MTQDQNETVRSLKAVLGAIQRPEFVAMLHGKKFAEKAVTSYGSVIDDLDQSYNLTSTQLGERLATIGAVLVRKATRVPSFLVKNKTSLKVSPTLMRASSMLIERAITDAYEKGGASQTAQMRKVRKLARELSGLCADKESAGMLSDVFSRHKLRFHAPTCPPAPHKTGSIEELSISLDEDLKKAESNLELHELTLSSLGPGLLLVEV